MAVVASHPKKIFGLTDPSAMPLEEVQSNQLDPLQRLRIRNAIKKYGGDQSLLVLADEELDGALGLCRKTTRDLRLCEPWVSRVGRSERVVNPV